MDLVYCDCVWAVSQGCFKHKEDTMRSLEKKHRQTDTQTGTQTDTQTRTQTDTHRHTATHRHTQTHTGP